MGNQDRKHKQLDVRVKAIAQTIPTSPEDVMDYKKMKREIDQIALESKWAEFNNAFEDLRLSFYNATESSEEHQHIADIATLSSEFGKTVGEMAAQVDETLKKYVITEEGRLARNIKDISIPVPTDQFKNLSVYSLPKRLVYEVRAFFKSS